MNRSLAAAIALLAAAVPNAQAQDRGFPRMERADRTPASGRVAINANPSRLIAAEIALGQLAKEKGEHKAMRDTAAEGAVIVEAEPVTVEEWLKGRAESPAATKWDAQSVWMSCDGSIGVVDGIWSQAEAGGRFVSVWQRQKKGEYKWLLRQLYGGQAAPVDPFDILSATVADCPQRPPRANGGPPQAKSEPPGEEPAPVDPLTGKSRDGSLTWRSDNDSSGTRRFLVRISKEGGMQTVLSAELEARLESWSLSETD